MTDSLFSSLPLARELLANLDTLGYTTMTPVQAASLPLILQGRDVIAQASTGSGKTAAFGLGLLHPLRLRERVCQGLVLCPTRELADQVAAEIRRLARGTGNIKVLSLCGGQPIGPQIGSLEHGVHIVVGTPGRILKHLDKGSLTLDSLQTLVLDEADRMLDMGFFDDIAKVIRQAPSGRKTLLFSATYPAGIKQLAETFMAQPEHVEVEALHDNTRIEQRFYEVDTHQRYETVAQALACFRPASCVVFCVTRQQCQEVVRLLCQQGMAARALNSDLEQRERDEVLTLFANRSLSVLVATDVAARGLDIDSLDMVINAELSHDPQTHIHRIGRTGRAGHKGLAISLVAAKEVPRASAIEALQGERLNWHPVNSLKPREGEGIVPPTVTLCIAAGRKDKLRPGDILGALTGEAGIPGDQVGKITVTDYQAYVAIEHASAELAFKRLVDGRIKGKKRRVRQL